MHLYELFDLTALDQHIENGLVGQQTHPELPLAILNYTHRAQWEMAWDAITTQCRGLIYNTETAEIVARPFPKFFNWDQSQVGKIPLGPMLKMPKMDGSLGVLYRAGDSWAVATRGSFVSDQAIRATRILQESELFVEYSGDWLLNRTYLFEIIYPENRIVVDYGGWEGLVLLDVIDNETGRADLEEFDETAWPDKVERQACATFSVDLVHEIRDDEEGFVLYWPYQNLRVKMKGPEYVRLHRILTGVSSKTVWEYLSQNRPFDRLLESVPDEFYQWVAKTREEMMQNYASLKAVMAAEFAQVLDQLPQGYSRKDFAALACRSTHSGALFKMLDNRPVDDLIWKALKPAYERPFVAQSEDVS